MHRQPLRQVPRSPGRAARKEARRGALRAPKDSLTPGSPARAPPGRPMTSLFASATMPREGARVPLHPCVLDMLRATPATSVQLSSQQDCRYARCERLTWDARDASENSAIVYTGGS